jgi:hypothetical protein
MNEFICLSDADGEIRYFDPADLAAQVAQTELEANGAARMAGKGLAKLVLEMRTAQKALRGNQRSDADTLAEIRMKCMALESKVDATLPTFLQTIEMT